jgi:glycosyltransferase involved in cell wall biosynthesis
LRRLVDARAYDAVIPIDSESYLEALASDSPAVPVIAELRQCSDAMLERIERRTLRGIIVPSELQRHRVLGHIYGDLRHHVAHVPDSADARLFTATAAEETHARRILIFRGELEEKDNWSTFLELGALAAIRAPELELWMLGGEDAPEEIAQSMMETAESLGVLKKLRWFPHLDRHGLARAYGHAGKSGGALIITKKAETAGQVALEAMLAGCPVLTAAPSAVFELLEAGETNRTFARSYPADELHQAEKVLVEMLQDPTHRMHKSLLAARAGLVAQFATEKTGEAYLAAVQRILGRE